MAFNIMCGMKKKKTREKKTKYRMFFPDRGQSNSCSVFLSQESVIPFSFQWFMYGV